MIQEVKRGKETLCTTSVSYPPNIIRDIQAAGYSVYQDGKLLGKRTKLVQKEGAT